MYSYNGERPWSSLYTKYYRYLVIVIIERLKDVLGEIVGPSLRSMSKKIESVVRTVNSILTYIQYPSTCHHRAYSPTVASNYTSPAPEHSPTSSLHPLHSVTLLHHLPPGAPLIPTNSQVPFSISRFHSPSPAPSLPPPLLVGR